jgi:hypothetical protein
LHMKKSTSAFFSFFFIYLFLITTRLQAEGCACVERHGHCACPQGECACMENGQSCECHPYEEACEVVDPCQITPLHQHQVYIGPEIFFTHREKELSVAKQNGWSYGGRIAYERIKRYRIYWGVDGLYSKGCLEGHSGDVKLHFTNKNIEGRIGYTIQKKNGFLPTLIPFVGYGYLQEISRFEKPIEVAHKERIAYDYFTAGFLSQFYPHRKWVLGLNFKARILFNSNCKISEDVKVEDFTQNFEQFVQYRVELPVIYRVSGTCDRVAIRLAPFYEYRHCGEQKNYPQNFLGTKLNMVGFNICLMGTF